MPGVLADKDFNFVVSTYAGAWRLWKCWQWTCAKWVSRCTVGCTYYEIGHSNDQKKSSKQFVVRFRNVCIGRRHVRGTNAIVRRHVV